MENPNTMTDITHILNRVFDDYTRQIQEHYCGSSFGRQAENALNAAGYMIVKSEPAQRAGLTEDVLCCAECETPLTFESGGGARCVPCGYYPSMQDTFIKKVSK